MYIRQRLKVLQNNWTMSKEALTEFCVEDWSFKSMVIFSPEAEPDDW